MLARDVKSQAFLATANSRAPLEGMGTLINQTKNVVRAVWDFAVQGGAVGTVNLLDEQGNAVLLPAGAFITNVVLDVVTPATTGASGTGSLGFLSTVDLLAATAAASITGVLAGIPVGTAATWKGPGTAALTPITFTIATGALTAGKFNAFIEYVVSR